ncbi:protein takeout-like [Ochlerotatus camptorhynchus]|uniref:protein takeout-like n=1 Tax=Ochlerotatus camptorhynchus TaxID=644619 RepID=UPI0031D8A51B
MKLIASAFVVILNLVVVLAELAPVLEVCSKNDPQLAQCIIKVVDKIRPNIANGDYGGGRMAPKLDPFSIEKLDIDRGASFRAKMRNVIIDGLSNFVIKKIRPDLENKRFHIIAKIPNCFVHGKYELNMNILLLKIAGKGDFNLTLDDTLVNLKVQYYLEPKDGKSYTKFHPVDLKIKFDKAKFYLKNLFGGDPALEQIGNQAINANPHLLLDEVKPAIQENLKISLTNISNAVVDGAEEDELLPEKKP